MQQVIQHAMSHRGAGATRTNARWHPYTPPRSSGSAPAPLYAAAVRSNSSASTSSATPPTATQYLNTPASTVYNVSPADVAQTRISPTLPIPYPPQCAGHAQPLLVKQSSAKSLPTKQTYVALLVDQAVRSLSDIWRPETIPAVFATNTRITVSTAPTPSHPSAQRNPLVRRLSLQLPSPCSPSTSLPSPTVCARKSNQQFTAGDAYISSTTVITEKELVPIKAFVHEVLRRSRTTCSVLQSALCYIEAIRKKVPELAEQERQGLGIRGEVNMEDRIVVGTEDEAPSDADATPCANNVPTEIMQTQPYDETEVPTILALDALTQSNSESRQNAADLLAKRRKIPSKPLEPLPPLPSPLLCPRRAFLAALILASKFLQDRCYSNRAWAKLSGLPPREVSRCERALGDALEWRLWVGKSSLPSEEPTRPVLRSRSEGFISLTPSTSHTLQVPSPPMSDAGASPEINRVAPPTLQRRSPQALRRASTAPELYRTSNLAPQTNATTTGLLSSMFSSTEDALGSNVASGLSVFPPQVTVTRPPLPTSADTVPPTTIFTSTQDISFLLTTDDHTTPRLGHSPSSLPESNLDTPSTQYSTTIWSPTYSAGSSSSGESGLMLSTTPPQQLSWSAVQKQVSDIGYGSFRAQISMSPENVLYFNPGSLCSQQQSAYAAMNSSLGFTPSDGMQFSAFNGS